MDDSNILFLFKIIELSILFPGSILLFFILSSALAILKTKVPFVPIPKENINLILNEIDLPKNSLLYDLGCGSAELLFKAEKKGYKTIGYELSLYPFLKAILTKKIFFHKTIIRKKNFFKANLKNANIIFLFLNNVIINNVKEKLEKELNPNTIIISYCFPIPNWQAYKVLNTQPSPTYFYLLKNQQNPILSYNKNYE